MNCDQAFEALTDPQQRNSESLSGHLETCNRCRDMQAVLEPALAMFAPEESVEDESFESLQPKSVGKESDTLFLSPEAIQIAQQTADELLKQQQPPAQTTARSRATVLMKYAAVLLVGAGLALGMMGLRTETNRATTPTALKNTDNCSWLHPEVADKTPSTSAHTVTMSCVACHLPSTFHQQ